VTTPKKIRNLPVELDDEERKQRGERLAECIMKKAAIAVARRTATSLAYRETQEVDAEIAALSDIVATGKEIREVEVEERKDLSARILKVIRLDTGELVDSRQLSIEELQDDLPFERSAGEHAVQWVSDEPFEESEEPAPEPAPRRSRKRPGANA
jgi:hypothetical protein